MTTNVTSNKNLTELDSPPSPPDEQQNKIFQNSKNKIKESVLPLNINEAIPEDTNQNENGEKEATTISTTLGFLDEKDINNQNDLNKINEDISNKDSSLTDTVVEVNKSDEQPKETFFGKTKRWAGNIWSKMNIKNYFPKQEYIEYKNANGIIMKIPKKKIPLKKKPNIDPNVEREENIVKKNSNNAVNYASGNTIYGGFY